MMLRKLRRAMVAAEREPLKREVEVDEFFLGRFSRPKRWPSAGKKVLCAIAVEVRGRGSGRLRLAILKDARKPSLSALMTATDRVRRDRSLEGLLQAVWPSPATTMPRRANGPSPSVTCRTCHAHVERSRTLRHGCMAPAAMPCASHSRPTSMLPSQPPRQPPRRVPDPARAQHPPPAGPPPTDHRSGRLTLGGEDRVCTRRE